MNKYRLPQDVYNRKYDTEISREEIHKRLVGDKVKEIVDIDDDVLMLEDKEQTEREMDESTNR